MAQAFAANVMTATGSHGAATDRNPPPAGSLSLGSMASPGAVAGTTGAHVKLVHGDRWNQIEGNLTENVLKNHTFFVKLNETYTVNTNLVYRVNGTTNDTRVGVDNRNNIQPRNDTFLHTRSETHSQPEHRLQKTEDHNFTEKLLAFKEEHYEWTGFKLKTENVTILLSAPLSYEKKLFGVGNDIFHMGHEEIAVEMKEIKASLGSLATEIKGCKVKAAATHLKAIAGNINAGIALNMDSPWG